MNRHSILLQILSHRAVWGRIGQIRTLISNALKHVESSQFPRFFRPSSDSDIDDGIEKVHTLSTAAIQFEFQKAKSICAASSK